MRDQLFKMFTTTKMEILAPISGGGVGIFAWAVKLAPLISIIAAVIGVALGIMSYRLKRQVSMKENELLNERLKQLKSNHENRLSE